jgi:hypothetical protein
MLCGGGHFGSFVPYPDPVRPPGAVFLSVAKDCHHCLWRCPYRADDQQAFPCVAEIAVADAWAAVAAMLSPSAGS